MSRNVGFRVAWTWFFIRITFMFTVWLVSWRKPGNMTNGLLVSSTKRHLWVHPSGSTGKWFRCLTPKCLFTYIYNVYIYIYIIYDITYIYILYYIYMFFPAPLKWSIHEMIKWFATKDWVLTLHVVCHLWFLQSVVLLSASFSNVSLKGQQLLGYHVCFLLGHKTHFSDIPAVTTSLYKGIIQSSSHKTAPLYIHIYT